MNSFAIHIALITLLDLAGMVCGKFYSISKNPLWLLATVLLFGGVGYTFAKSLKYEGMAITNVLWVALSVVLVTIIGYFFFKERISLLQFGGIGLIIAGLFLVNLK